MPESRFHREVEEVPESSALQRLSPAARLGSSKVHGSHAIIVPDSLEHAVAEHVLRANKAQLRRDATHLVALAQTPSTQELGLTQRPCDHFQGSLRGSRASSLYLATQFPARYAVITRVLDEVRRRLLSTTPKPWAPARIIDWNAQAFDALWASLGVFGSAPEYSAEAWSKELLSTATQLIHTLRADGSALQEALSSLSASFRLRGDKPVTLGRSPSETAASPTLGVYAYGLCGLPNDAARERQIHRMWKSRADVLVLIEEATPRGFASIAAARAQLLSLGSDEAPCHVVAPCPHDRACPMLNPSTLHMPPTRAVPNICSYSQMYHAPSFSRATLRDARSDRVEDYCYVVVQRGARPSLSHAQDAWSAELPEISRPVLSASVQALADESKKGILDALRSEEPRELLQVDQMEPGREQETAVATLQERGVDAHRVMQLEAYAWPRIVRTPLKKGGHVTIDACCSNGALERFTIAKSAGRQPYQDARKARTGELFPHAEKSGRPTVQREAQDLNQPPEWAVPRRTSDHEAAPSEEEHMYIGPDAQLYARTSGTSRAPKRTSRRAPKKSSLVVSERGTRLSRKPNRARLDEELHGWDDVYQ